MSFSRLKDRTAALALASAFLWCAVALAQTGTGEVNGTIADSSGGVVPGAAVRLVNRATQITNQTQTNSSGYFVFINVQPGSYTLTVEAKGFKTAQVPALQLAVNQSLTQNLDLDLGTVTETMTVSSEAPLLQASSTELGSVISQQAVVELPLNGRNFTQLMILTPGANPVSTAQGSGISTTDAGLTGIPGTQFFKPSLHGQFNRSVLYYLDGITNTDFRGSVYGFLPIIDAVAEFKVESHDSTAQFGGVLGGVVDLVSKSGANSFHGAGWEFLRNNAFDARNPFTDLCNVARCGAGSIAGTPAPPIAYHQNEFGAALGGPIRKNKTFFYAAHQGWRYKKPTLNLGLVPTSAELSGNFAGDFYNQAIYNPYSTSCTNGTCTRQPFPNNTIPGSLISAPMQSILGAYAYAPNFPLYNGSNYLETRQQVDNSDGYQVRIDHRISDKTSIFGRISQMWVDDTQPVTGAHETSPSSYHAYNFGGAYDHIFTPSLILDVRGGAMLKPYVFENPLADAGSAPLTAAGFKNLDQYGGMYVSLASPYIGNLGSMLPGAQHRGNPGVNWDASVSWFKGNHEIKMGAQYTYLNRLQTNLYQQFAFADTQTANINGGSAVAKTGNSLASALLGTPNTFTAQTPVYSEVYFNNQVWSGYIQDKWKVRPNLTISVGLRYDYLPKLKPLNSRLSNGLDLFKQQYLIGAKSVAACSSPFADPCIPGGINSVPYNSNIVFTGEKSVTPPAVSDNIGPRVGISWNVLKNTVLRASWGLYYDTLSARSQYAQNSVEGPTWPWTIGVSNLATNVFTGGIWPGATGNPLQLITNLEGASPDPIVAATPWATAGGGYTNDPHYKNARAQEWNVELQRQLTPSIMFSAAYVGSHSDRLDYAGYANAAQHSNPIGTPAATIDAEKLMPIMVPTWHYSQSIGYGNYTALETKLEKRWSQNLLTIVSYTWSHSLDDSSGFFGVEGGSGGGSIVQNYFAPASNYGSSGYNIPQLLTWSVVYSLPFGRGERYLSHGPLSWILGNWEANYVFLARSGQPFTIQVPGDVAVISGSGGTVGTYARPNIVGDPKSACTINGQSVPSGTAACFFNPAAFAAPSGSYGNAGRDILHNEHSENMDFSLMKNIPVREKIKLQLRFEAFNVFNFQILGTPNVTLGQSSTGVITSVSSTPRQLQMGAKVTF